MEARQMKAVRLQYNPGRCNSGTLKLLFSFIPKFNHAPFRLDAARGLRSCEPIQTALLCIVQTRCPKSINGYSFILLYMSCLSFKKLFPAKKTWRTIRLKFQGRKIHKSKVIKKPKRSRKKTSKKKLFTWPNFCIFQRKKLKPKNPSRTLPAYKYYFQKTASPVYIDQLFIEPAVSVVKATTVCRSIVTLKGTEANNEEGNSSSTCSAKKLVDDYGEMQVNVRVGTSRDEEGCHHSAEADDMWESMAESPHMDEINERAEEFIASFRAEMQLQEMIARHL